MSNQLKVKISSFLFREKHAYFLNYKFNLKNSFASHSVLFNLKLIQFTFNELDLISKQYSTEMPVQLVLITRMSLKKMPASIKAEQRMVQKFPTHTVLSNNKQAWNFGLKSCHSKSNASKVASVPSALKKNYFGDPLKIKWVCCERFFCEVCFTQTLL